MSPAFRFEPAGEADFEAALPGARTNRFYLRHGFVCVGNAPLDVFHRRALPAP